MRKIRKVVGIVAVFAAIVSLAGCGCQNTSESSNSQKNNQVDVNSKSETKEKPIQTNTQNDIVPDKSLTERKSVKYEDFIKNGEFNLTEYAEALGYTRLVSPDDHDVVMYAIEVNGTKCFFSYMSNATYAFFDQKDGYTYEASPEGGQTNPKDVTIVSEGQKNQFTSWRGLDYIVVPLQHMATTESISLDYIPGFALIRKYSGSARYLSNGMINYEVLDKPIESLECHGLNF